MAWTDAARLASAAARRAKKGTGIGSMSFNPNKHLRTPKGRISKTGKAALKKQYIKQGGSNTLRGGLGKANKKKSAASDSAKNLNKTKKAYIRPTHTSGKRVKGATGRSIRMR